MTYDDAIAFFAEHGNVCSDPELLRRQTPSAQQLDMAVDWAVRVRGQPRSVAEAAKDAVPPARDRCEACGRFIAEGKARVLFTPDTDFGPEMTEVYCEPCDDRHRAAFRRIAGYERPY